MIIISKKNLAKLLFSAYFILIILLIFNIRTTYAQELNNQTISLNFQDIEIRAALKILADYSGFNLIVSDAVTGNLTMRLKNVNYKDALNIILRSKNLDKRYLDNILFIGTTTEIIAREKIELESLQQVHSLEPLKSELIQINYSKAEDLQTILKEKDNSVMSLRGNVTVDKRTNTLLVQDTTKKLEEIKKLIRKLDIPVKQVEIATQIITADCTLEEVLGVRLGGAMQINGKNPIGVGSTIERARAITNSTSNSPSPCANVPSGFITNTTIGGPTVPTTEGLFSDLPASFSSTAAAGLLPAKIGLAFARIPMGTLIDLELQALEYESKIKTLSKPKLTTTDKTKAYVEQGFEIPYLEASASGSTSVAFKKAVLKLEVTPQITPDNKIILDLLITNDTPQNITSLVAGTPGVSGTAIGIKTSRISTQILVNNGETIVLGGVFTYADSKKCARVPFFGQLPVIGNFFKNKSKVEERREVLIFITPRIGCTTDY